jgi:hypothetical protein
MKFTLPWPCLLPLLVAAGPLPSTQPALITLHAKEMPPAALLSELARQTGAAMPLSPADLLKKNSVSNLTLDLNHVSFWQTMEMISQKTGIEPTLIADDPYPRFRLGLGKGIFWEEPHVVAGPLVLFVNDVQRSNSVDLRIKKGNQFERQLTVNLTAFAEPGVILLSASPSIHLKSAVDTKGRVLQADNSDEFDPSEDEAAEGLYTWNLAVTLHCPVDTADKIARLKGATTVRLQTATERFEVNEVLKTRNLTRVVAGLPMTFRNLKKADDEYFMQVQLRRDKKSLSAWQDLYHSLLSGRLALYDEKGRLVAGRSTEMGVDRTSNRMDATLRFAREPGISDPQAGEPFKLVWLAPTAGKDIILDFELTNLPIPP